jgi:high-affinity nickel-transport protein
MAVGFGKAISATVEPWQDWILIAVGLANVYRLFRPGRGHHHHVPAGLQASPVMLGVIFGMGFETASQISALLIAGRMNPWIVGAVFSLGMVLVDGADGWMAARTQQLAQGSTRRALRASQASRGLSVLVILFSFGLAAADFARIDTGRIALPLGLTMFTVLFGLRLWASWSGRTVQAQALTSPPSIRPGAQTCYNRPDASLRPTYFPVTSSGADLGLSGRTDSGAPPGGHRAE